MELMDRPQSEEDYCNIDWNTRIITPPENLTNLGVYNDKDTQRIYFRCPATYGDCTVADYGIRVNYINTGESGQEYDGDIYLVDDVAVDGDYLTFSWLVGRRAYLEQGTTAFIVCCKIVDNEGTVQNELNTTVMRLAVLEGLEIEVTEWEDEYPDIIEELLQKADEAIKTANGVDAKATEALEKANDAMEANANAITGINVNGTAASVSDHVANIEIDESTKVYFGICYEQPEVATKPIDIDGFVLEEGVIVVICFFYGNTVNQIKLDISGTGAKRVPMGMDMGSRWGAVTFVYSDGYYICDPAINIASAANERAEDAWNYAQNTATTAITVITVNGESVPVKNNTAEITTKEPTYDADSETLIF